jgi:HK97 gp10 family phage protein
MMAAQPLFSIDYEKIRKLMIGAAINATNATALFVQDRAQELAPVRKVFVESGRRVQKRVMTPLEHLRMQQLYKRSGLGPSRSQLASSEMIFHAKRAGLASPLRGGHLGKALFALGPSKIAPHGARGRDLYRGNKEVGFSRTTVSTISRTGHTTYPGRSNQYVPVFRLDRGEFHVGSREVAQNGQQRVDATSHSMLSSRGRSELRSGDATHAVGSQNVLGGKLRKSIRVIPAAVSGNHVVAYVIAGNDEDVDYAIYQELGTVHNAAHPFMRPALREGRRVLLEQVSRAASQIERVAKPYGPSAKYNMGSGGLQRHGVNPGAVGISPTAARQVSRDAAQQARERVTSNQMGEVSMPRDVERLFKHLGGE